MDRYAIFVDAGYFFAAGAQAAFGLRTPPHMRRIRGQFITAIKTTKR